jgi:AcrR family transcriptional regulator
MDLSSPNRPSPTLPLGLRERKKAKTRAAIQEHALRLFRERGYSRTTIEQIAAAAEVSPSTFFRYFPTKEDVVLFDATDPLMLDALEAQPPDLNVIEAIRRSFRGVYAGLTPDELERERDRQRLVLSEPEIRMRAINTVVESIDSIAQLVATRTAHAADDIAVRAFAGALVGALMATWSTVDMDSVELPEILDLVDATLTQIEAGLPL